MTKTAYRSAICPRSGGERTQSWRALPDPVRLFHGKLAAAEGGSQRFDVAFAELSQIRITDDAAKR